MSAPATAGPISRAAAARILERLYGISGTIEELPGEHDQNFWVTTGAGDYVLKVHAAMASPGVIDLQDSALAYLARHHPSLPVQRAVPTCDGEQVARATLEDGSARLARLLTWLPGGVWADVDHRTPSLFASLGQFVARLDEALRGFEHPEMQRHYLWGMQYAAEHRQFLALIPDETRRTAVAEVLARFEQHVNPRLGRCRHQVIHNDASDRNIVVSPEGEVVGLIDFGDLIHAPAVCGLAVACAYAMLGQAQPVNAILPLIAAYDDVTSLTDLELELLFDLVQTRLAMSICMAAWQSNSAPHNAYLLVSQEDVWELLQRLRCQNRHLIHFTIRDACGRSPNPQARAIVQWLEANSGTFAAVCRHDLRTVGRVWFDFTAGSEESACLESLPSVAAVADELFGRMRQAGATVGIGRYLEDRAWYRAPRFAVPGSDERRTVHLGVDLFLEPGEPVYAPLDGTLCAFHDNAVEGDYGPVVILQHRTGDGVPFWTLYGHLSRDSLERHTVGHVVARGQEIGRIGTYPTNGNWAPHLHLQLLTHSLDAGCTVDGVAAVSALNVWESISPDPNLLLGIPEGIRAGIMREPQQLLRERRRHLSRSLHLSYADPLKIVRAHGLFLYDERGRAYLDMVNNVCHVGYCHRRVVEAGQQQMARLNTNTRYLYDSLVEYVRRLLATFPESLTVCFLVNSGSEANDLALRLARTHTRRRGVLVIDQAYHGNLSSLVELSPYKFDGPGGSGRPDYVRVCQTPDGYRGPFKYADPDYGRHYAADVGQKVDELVRMDGVAALFAESALSCAGQIVLPPDYLAEAYAYVRAAGGVCVADEVQVGLGRVGTAMWAFETQGVVPDIVTLGKPLGNGHPLAAVVTTPEIAASFDTGMEYFNTFGGNPVSAAIGLAVLDVIRDERLQQNARSAGHRILAGLRALAERDPLIGDVRGVGLFLGVELVRDRRTLEPADFEARRIIERTKDLGVLLSIDGPHHNVLKIKPPIAIEREQCSFFLSVLEQALREEATGRLRDKQGPGLGFRTAT